MLSPLLCIIIVIRGSSLFFDILILCHWCDIIFRVQTKLQTTLFSARAMCNSHVFAIQMQILSSGRVGSKWCPCCIPVSWGFYS